LWCLFADASHTIVIHGFLSGAGTNRSWSGKEGPAILFAELAALVPALEKKGVTIPDEISSFTNGVKFCELVSHQVQNAREAFRQSMVGQSFTQKYIWDDESTRILIRAVQHNGRRWEIIRRTHFSHVFDEEASIRGGRNLCKCLSNRWDGLNTVKDPRIGEEKAKLGSIQGFFKP
jgi:hypothetical protein